MLMIARLNAQNQTPYRSRARSWKDHRLRAVGACALLMLLSRPAPADSRAILIGGGYDTYNSQVQIEENVLWARRVLNTRLGEGNVRVYFDDGTAPWPDITEHQSPPEEPGYLQPFARVFNSYWANGERYRNHRIPNVAGGTEAGPLLEDLEHRFRTLKTGDAVFLVYSGHGGYNEKDRRHNTLELWNQTRLDVNELATLLEKVPPGIPVRFVFTQCYAGAFAALADPVAPRCGFLAEAADQPAEGCSASLDLDDYRDYGHDFFAALAGHERNGGPLATDPDRNKNGEVSPREAHLYTLRTARSSDLPRATSEVYLEDWLPGYLGWMLGLQAPDNIYMDLATALMHREHLDPEKPLDGQLKVRRDALLAEAHRLGGEQERLSDAIAALREPLENEITARWPATGNPYTLGYSRFLERDLETAQDYILAQPDYQELAHRQNRYWKLESRLLDNERALTQLAKIQRMRRLGRIRGLFERFASEGERRAYRALVDCEEMSLSNHP